MIDIDHQINAVRRTVGERTLEAGEARTVTVSQVYDTTVDDLWDACTDPERIPRWFLPISGELRLGGRYQLEGNAGGTVTECDAPRSFAATWEYGGGISWIEVRLSPEGEGTRFELTHVARVDDAIWEQFGPGAVGIGWDGMLLGLVLHLPSGASVTTEGQEWMASPEGLAFYRAAGESWHDADVASGTPADVARERADRCIAAYTEVPDDPA